MLQVTTQREDVPYYKLSTSYAAATYCGFFVQSIFPLASEEAFLQSFFLYIFTGK